ncbi:MAG: Response regulator [Chlorobi bacterium]|nr:Response regulator [Chlorobiota bacterium]
MARSIDDLLDFINAFPTEPDPVKWGAQASGIIREFLGDVDLVWMNPGAVAVAADPADPDTHPTIGDNERKWEQLALYMPPAPISNHMILKSFHLNGFPADACHPLHRFDYHLPDYPYLGSIVLMRLKFRPPILPATLHLMEEMQCFIASQFLRVRQVYHEQNPIVGIFNSIVDSIVEEIGLTEREKEVMLPRAFGMSYQEIADQLHLTPVAIKKRVLRIHRKANVTSQSQLFGKYFSPYYREYVRMGK